VKGGHHCLCPIFAKCFYRTHLKNRILVQDRGGAEFKTGGILLYVEDFKRGTNKEIGAKDIFEMGSNKKQSGYYRFAFLLTF
jgi:hypothetical protein